MLSDIEVINQAKLVEMRKIARHYGLKDEELYLIGKHLAKVELSAFKRLENKKDGKLILVSAITPTPAGEGKSTTLIGMVDTLNKMGKKCIGTIREPSLGPVFGVKGGAAGGGYSQLNPMVDMNLHFTGDLHAVTTANNLVSAIIDNHIFQGNELGINPTKVVWKRCIDLNDRALRKVTVALESKKETPREDGFNITVASEIMASLCLSDSYHALRERLDRMIVAYDFSDKPITIKDLKITGSLLVLLKNALKPNLIQTLENNLFICHGGPFANIAHGCNSILATKLALKLTDYVVTEAGFGVDLGAEKFLDIKCQEAKLNPSLVIIVATIRALKFHGGQDAADLKTPNVLTLQRGICNLERHLETIKKFNLPAVVALNRFESDSKEEIEFIMNWGQEHQVDVALSEVFAKGSAGGMDLAEKVLKNIQPRRKYHPLYDIHESLFTKIEKICVEVYHATNIEYAPEVFEQIKKYNQGNYQDYYVCMAKCQTSVTDNPKIAGVPKNHTIHIKEVRLAAGSKFLVCLTGSIMTMPGLNKEPQAIKIDMDDDGNVTGLM
jgi:formate--tetrahydrofolate ligase